MSAISGIDQVLWDIKGKYYHAPIYQLLGGARPAEVGDAAKEAVEAGSTAVKMNGTEELEIMDSYEKVDQAVARIAAVRESVGPYIGIGIDFYGCVHKPMAKVVAKEREQYRT